MQRNTKYVLAPWSDNIVAANLLDLCVHAPWMSLWRKCLLMCSRSYCQIKLESLMSYIGSCIDPNPQSNSPFWIRSKLLSTCVWEPLSHVPLRFLWCSQITPRWPLGGSPTHLETSSEVRAVLALLVPVGWFRQDSFILVVWMYPDLLFLEDHLMATGIHAFVFIVKVRNRLKWFQS